jgi:purine-nucleoside phosphorylase
MSPVHVRAEPGDFAKSVLLPGDPLRAKYIAETYFEDAKLVTEERGMLGYTGTYRGKPVSVQARRYMSAGMPRKRMQRSAVAGTQ